MWWVNWLVKNIDCVLYILPPITMEVENGFARIWLACLQISRLCIYCPLPWYYHNCWRSSPGWYPKFNRSHEMPLFWGRASQKYSLYRVFLFSDLYNCMYMQMIQLILVCLVVLGPLPNTSGLYWLGLIWWNTVMVWYIINISKKGIYYVITLNFQRLS